MDLHNDMTLHHAYLLIGEKESGKRHVEGICGGLMMPTKGNPDVHFYEYETMGIDESRALSERVQQKSVGGKKFFTLAFGAMTREAQNALLKLLEEPPEDTHFFLIAASEEALLPTVRSRVLTLRLADDAAPDGARADMVDAFLHASPGGRIVIVSKLTDDRQRALSFLTALEKRLSAQSTNVRIKDSAVMRELLYARRNLYARGGSVKMLLEHLALLFP